MLVVANGRISVFLNADIYLTFSLFIYPSTHIELVSIPWILWIMLQWTWEYRLSFHDSDFVSFGYIPRRLLDHMVVLFLSSWGTSILPSIVSALIYIPTYTVPEFHFLHILTSILLSLVFLITNILTSVSPVQSLSHVWLFATPWTAAHQVARSITNSQILLKLTSIESVMPSNHFILCFPLLLLSSSFPSIRVFYNESVFCIRWA